MTDQADLNQEVLTLEEVAGYLKVSPKTIHRMLQAKEIPALKVGGQWRFLRDTIVIWLSERIVGAKESGLVKVITTAQTVVPITRLAGPERIVLDIAPGSKADVLRPMVQALADSGAQIDPKEYLEWLLQREEMVSTAVGKGTAFPHVRQPENAPVQQPCIVLGICPQGTDFASLDGQPTYVLAMSCSPTEVVHLRMLAKLSLLFKDPDALDQIVSAKTKQDVMSILVRADVKLASSF